jgi:hypothetical protein
VSLVPFVFGSNGKQLLFAVWALADAEVGMDMHREEAFRTCLAAHDKVDIVGDTQEVVVGDEAPFEGSLAKTAVSFEAREDSR